MVSPRACRWCRARRAICAPVPKSPVLPMPGNPRHGRRRELFRRVHPPAGDDYHAHVGADHLRSRRLLQAAGERASQRRFPHDQRFREFAGRRSADHGGRGGDAARAPVQRHRRHHLDEFGEQHGQHQYHDTIRSRARHRRRRARRADRDLAAQTPPSLRKANPADFAIIYIALTAEQLPRTELDEYAETRVAQQISTIPGVAQVLVFGSYKYAVRLYMNPYALAARNLSLAQVEQAIQSGNTNLPTGTLNGSVRSYTLQAEGQLENAEAYNRLVIAYRNGASVRLSDVGEAQDSREQDKQLTSFFDNNATKHNKQPTNKQTKKHQPNTNTDENTRAVRAQLDELTRQAPGDATLGLLYDRADYINGSIHEVKLTLIIAIVLVVGVIFLFLRNARATLISALALPTSLVGPFAVMKLCGFSLDNLSLMARMQAAFVGSKEIGFTEMSMTLSLVAVFIPIMFMSGIVGRLFREFALTVAIAILISGLVSLTLTPMLCSRFIKQKESHGRLYHMLERGFDYVRD